MVAGRLQAASQMSQMSQWRNLGIPLTLIRDGERLAQAAIVA
jgi:hypothetical protein